ncbi:hypothetical protein FACS1894216_20620 [Synergistales bacterium]|nr:hypothetical protein FACS1894216_20620 [Synergistales bacterium]
MILKVGLNGELRGGNGLPSSEMKLHLRVYTSAPQFKAVIHAHPPYATAFAVAGATFSPLSYPTSYAVLGEIPLARYAVASTDELASSIEPFVTAGKQAILMENHGAVTCGESVRDAYYLMERLEAHAKIDYLAKHLGGARELTEEEKKRFFELDAHRVVLT